jgi:hypothetical protein
VTATPHGQLSQPPSRACRSGSDSSRGTPTPTRLQQAGLPVHPSSRERRSPSRSGGGLAEREAKASGDAHGVASLPLGSVARAIETDEKAVVRKTLLEPASERILGASIVGAEAGGLIHVFAALMQADATARALVDMEVAHPSFAEGVQAVVMALPRHALSSVPSGWRSSLRASFGASSERECECLDPRIQELDRELPIGDGDGLADELVQPLLGHRPITLFVRVGSVSCARELEVDLLMRLPCGAPVYVKKAVTRPLPGIDRRRTS